MATPASWLRCTGFSVLLMQRILTRSTFGGRSYYRSSPERSWNGLRPWSIETLPNTKPQERYLRGVRSTTNGLIRPGGEPCSQVVSSARCFGPFVASRRGVPKGEEREREHDNDEDKAAHSSLGKHGRPNGNARVPPWVYGGGGNAGRRSSLGATREKLI